MFRFSTFRSRVDVNPHREVGQNRQIVRVATMKTGVTTLGGSIAQPSGLRTPSTIRSQTGNPLMDNSLVDSWIPIDSMGLHQLWRRIYLRDYICGSAIDFWRDLPWSDFTLGGIDDKGILQQYNDCLKDYLKITEWLPEISTEFLTLGKVALHFLFDGNRGLFTDLIVHNPDNLDISKPATINQPIKVDLKPTDEHRQFLESTDPRDQVAKRSLPKSVLRLMAAQQPIPLDPKNTLYLPRKAFPYDVDGMSVYSRVLYLVALERTLFTASILAARRRAGPVTHIQAGDDDWEPTPNELDALTQGWIEAEEDAVSAVVATRKDVQISRAVSTIATDLWKISEEAQFIDGGKMKALGISEDLLSGQANYNTMEQSLSIMLERIRSHRTFMTQRVIQGKICRELALANGWFKRKQADLDHRVRTGSDEDEHNLLIPTVAWHKQLRPNSNDAVAALLQTAEEKGLPVTVRDWAGATGFPLEESLDNMKEDLDLRKRLFAYAQEKQKYSSNPQGDLMEQQGGGAQGGDLASMLGAPGAEGPADGTPPGNPDATSAAVETPAWQEKINKRVATLAIWGESGRCIDLHRGEAIERLYDADLMQSIITFGRWELLKPELQKKYEWSDRKLEPFGYVLFRLGFLRDFTPDSSLIAELSERARRADTGSVDAKPLMREMQYLALMSQARRQVQFGDVRTASRREERIPNANLLTGVTV